MNALGSTALAMGLVVGACGGDGKPSTTGPTRPLESLPEHPDAAPGEAEPDDVGVQALRGRMSVAAIQAGVTPHVAKLQACFTDNVGKRKWLGGTVMIKWWVEADGAVAQVQLSESDLGAWPIERCVVDVAATMTFAAPKGGAADFALPIEFPSRTSPVWWDEDRGNAVVAKRMPDLDLCTTALTPAPADSIVTVYVGSGGKVESTGFAVASDDGLDPAWADCAAAKVSAWMLSDPKGKVAKLAFRYPFAS